MPIRLIGDLRVSAVGLGAMTLTQTPEHDPERGVTVVAQALESGINFFDTADSYGPIGEMGINELALIRSLKETNEPLDNVVIATKAGHTRGPNATWWVDGSPKHIKNAARASLKRLQLETLPLYQHHRPDVKVPYEETMGAYKELVEEGLVERVGISNVGLAQIETAYEILGEHLVSVQNEYSPLERSNYQILKHCEERGLAFLAYSPLGGMRQAKQLTTGIKEFAQVAEELTVSPQQVAIAWLLSLSPAMIPIPGASRPESVRDSAIAAEIQLSKDQLQRLNEATA